MLSLSIICGSSMTAFASPEPTSDGGVFDAEYYAEEDTLYTVNTTGLASNGHSDKFVNMNCWFTDMDEDNSLVAKAGYEWKRIATYTDQRNEVSYRYGYQGGAWGIYVDSSTNMTRTEACPYVYVYQTGMKDNGNGESVIDWSRKIL